jgi:hypothetical protein
MLGVACAAVALTQEKETRPAPRYGYEPDLDNYPQATPKDTLASVLDAIDHQRIGYLLAELTDPKWVDERVRAVHGGKFDAMVKETQETLARDPTAIDDLRRFLRKGQWQESGDTASVGAKGAHDRAYFRQIGKRWFLENRKTEAKEK